LVDNWQRYGQKKSATFFIGPPCTNIMSALKKLHQTTEENLLCCIVKQLHQTFTSTQEWIACCQAAHIVVDAIQLPTLTQISQQLP